MQYSEKTIPKTLEECYREDPLCSDLSTWSNRFRIWGERVLVIIVIAGIVFTIMDVIQFSNINNAGIGLSVITSLFTWGMYAFIEYCAYNVLSLLVISLAKIVQNTKVTASVALYKAANEEKMKMKEEINKAESTINNETKSSTEQFVNKKNGTNDFWTCKVCGVKNNSVDIYCNGCGTLK